MKQLCRCLLAVVLLALLAQVAIAQVQSGMFSHVIIIVQENRTPDSLFGIGAAGPTGCVTRGPFAPGVDIQSGGVGIVKGQTGLICNTSQPMNAGFDPNHSYEGWWGDWDNGLMDSFCAGAQWPNCQAYSYVQQSDVQPYLAIASTYGFANYFFQTNEGSSFAAHQFLFTGTSAPVAPHDPGNYYWDFVRTDPGFDNSGCSYASGAPNWMEPDRTSVAAKLSPMCYAHDSLVTSSNCVNGVCDKGVSWAYYSPSKVGIIWDAPAVIPEVCYGENDVTHAGSDCGSYGSEWQQHMKFSTVDDNAPIFSDIANCQLQQVSWVIPDFAWSDHPSLQDVNGSALGPSWVGNIVNAIGMSYANSGGRCDYWGTHLPPGKAEPTAIFVVWDDWGGFYDHVPPPNVWTGTRSGSNWTCPAPNQWGCGYTYGFRVPLLVVSEYTGTLSNGKFKGYISGLCGIKGEPSCPNVKYPYVHDFGSILAFTEYNFNLPAIDVADKGYADYNALDWDVGHTIPPLSDFFPLYSGSSSVGRPFVHIPTIPFPAGFFKKYYATHHATPTGPDTD